MAHAISTLPVDAIEALASAVHADPFSVLGPHRATVEGREGIVVRVFLPAAGRIDLVRPSGAITMARCDPAGLFEAFVESPGAGAIETFAYRLRVAYQNGRIREQDDPYRYGRVLSDFDLYLLGQGTHDRAFEKLGAHRRTIGSTTGIHFAVWAPNAERVSVLGDFNGWDGRVYPMRNLGSSGVWEIFVPDLVDGERYKYEIRSRADGTLVQKTDPYGVYFEATPGSASIVWTLDRHAWRDQDWMARRAGQQAWLDRPMSIYEVHLGSWRRVPERDAAPLTYRELADQLVPYVREMGYTHVELLPVMEHPFAGSWGYQVVGFFAPTSRFGPPEDFKAFVDECHVNGIGVILDWVPGHFPKDAYGLARFDGTCLYEHEDPRQGEHREWGTLIFNYGRHEVRNFLLSNALFWLGEYHVDGLRVDAVASMLYLDYSRRQGEWMPNAYGGRENLAAIDFLRQLNVRTHSQHPGTVTIAEESTAWPAVSRPVHLGGLGFTYKWNMGWMHDMIGYCRKDPIHRRWAHSDLTFSMLYAFTENFILPFSHDEVVHGKGSLLDNMPGDVWQKRATLRALYGYMFGHPGKKLMFMGDEFGQWREWSHDESLDWHLLADAGHAGIQRWVRDLNDCYQREHALHEVDFEPAGFEWIDCSDHESSVVSFIRRARDPKDFVVMVMNFTPVPREDYIIGVPEAGRYLELLNSDAGSYGGGDLGNAG
ncbi:MAG TPA: 1,4-alpha-glucan branching protein GlgB, partial [Coriobacteriia bacterium]